MSDHEHDAEVARRYRGLGREEPPPELDAAIRAEARRAMVTHAAPLVPPTGRSRWYFPVAAAAVIVLAVAITAQVEREQPTVLSDAASERRAQSGPKVPAQPAPAQRAAEAKPAESANQMRDQSARRRDAPARARAAPEKPASPPQFAPEPDAQTGARAKDRQPDSADALSSMSGGIVRGQSSGSVTREVQAPKVEEERARAQAQGAPQTSADSAAHKNELFRQEAPASAAVAPQAAPAPAEASRYAAPAPAPGIASRGVTPVDPEPLAKLHLDEAPAPWLERIAKLRAEGRHGEADKEFEAFRKRYPSYQISPDVARRIEKK